MGLPASSLPATIVDFLAANDPELVRLARADAARLVESGHEPGFARLEEVPTSFFDLVERRLERLYVAEAQRLGTSRDDARAAVVAREGEELRLRFEELARHYHLVLNLEMAGGKTYRVAPALAERLLETRDDVPAQALRLPFRSLMLVFDDDASLAAFHTGRPFGPNPGRGAISSILFDLQVGSEPCLLAASLHTRGRRTHGMMQRSMRYGEGSLDAMLSTAWPGVDDAPIRAKGRDFHRLLLNTVLYITSQGARVSPPRRDAGARDPLNRSPRKFMALGEGLVPLGPRRAVGETRRGEVSDRRSVRQLVAGHWRYHARGQGRLERRLLWIEPYWRGADFAQVVNRARLVR
ncbi:hypothetical protein [Sphingomonas corticis]|uniref:Uncharacterized protein n=1 Tax=Sphingomonas corticis TaxID=2722791 RepID=A0ABX1CTJ6_9SPHN|nr:hypothetical protein [Sphingomonas corticis]NJR80288.1 hypothetical protein [Sphingomonas corticis]